MRKIKGNVAIGNLIGADNTSKAPLMKFKMYVHTGYFVKF
jgi:hypothetical protein